MIFQTRLILYLRIWNITKGYVKREDIPVDVLKRVDAEIKFVRERL